MEVTIKLNLEKEENREIFAMISRIWRDKNQIYIINRRKQTKGEKENVNN